MSVSLTNDRGEEIDFCNGKFDLLANSGAGLLAGWAPSWRPDHSVHLHDDGCSFGVTGADDCKMFARLLRLYVRVLEERCTSYEKLNGYAVKDEDRSWGAHALLRRDELPFLLDVADFFERSEHVRRAG